MKNKRRIHSAEFNLNSEVEDAIPRSPGSRTFKILKLSDPLCGKPAPVTRARVV
jgi:hypothetical protein